MNTTGHDVEHIILSLLLTPSEKQHSTLIDGQTSFYKEKQNKWYLKVKISTILSVLKDETLQDITRSELIPMIWDIDDYDIVWFFDEDCLMNKGRIDESLSWY